ncbi:MAG: CDP-alcohol phosphatidyltransferase family protein [Rudaea sp.]
MNSRAPKPITTPWRHLPNAITLTRFVLVVPLVVFVARHDFDAALIVVAVAGASDALDGLLAKRYGWQSWLGGVIDPLADKLLLLSCFISLNLADVLPSWMMWLAIARDLVIVFGATTYHFLVGKVVPQPSTLSKATTCLQIAFVIALLVNHSSWFALPVALIDALLWIAAAATACSGLQYVYVWSRKAIVAKRAQVNA